MLLAVGAHLIGGGRLPSAPVLSIGTFLVGLVAVTLTARRLRFGALTMVLGVEQLLLHLVFDAASMSASGCPGDPAGGHGVAMSGCLTDWHPMASSPGPGTGMLLAHLAATVATAWLLAHGEGRLWALCDRAVRAATVAPTPRVRRPRLPRPLPGPALRAGERRTTADSRAPPALARSG